MAHSAVKESTPATNSSKLWALAKGTFKTALGIAATLAPEPFKGPAEALLKVVDVVEKADSNKEEVEILEKRCDLLGSSIVNVVSGKDTNLLSEDLKNSIGRLVVGIQDTLKVMIKEKSTGLAAYVLVEDDVGVLKNANKKLDELLQCFWIENHIAGTIVLSNILATVQEQAEWMQGLSTLDKHFENATLNQLKWVPGAAYDSQEVADKVVSCFEGTRSTLLANVGRWMSGSTSDGHPPLYVLDGIAGIGKSTVAITVAERAAGINSLGATFFFSRDQEGRKSSLGFVHTVAYQLAWYDASYGTAIAGAITSNPEALSKVLTQQFDLLVTKPLCPLLEQRITPLVLVFDALDECIEGKGALAILNLIICSVSQLPNVKVFLTSRPELGLRTKYMGTKEANVFHLQDIEDLIVEQDISLYVNHSLSSVQMQEALGDSYHPSWQPRAEDKAKLAKLSGKLFIFASTAIKFILDEQYQDPLGQLAQILDLQSKNSSPISQLDDLYLNVLKSAKPAGEAKTWLSRFQKIVGAILAIQVPLSALILEKLLDQGEGTVQAALANLHSILAPLGKGPTLTYKVHHKSFPDFITSSFCPAEFQILEKEQHLELAKCCLKVMNRQLKFNICQVSVPSEDQYKDLDDLLKEGLTTDRISKELEYAVCYWANHLGKLEEMDSDLIALLGEFSKKHLMHWLEVLAYIKQLDIAYTMLKTTLAKLVCQL
ncbi:hypothetical protein H1R20_g13844, partial [Candolleomyces eurysporus]